MRWALYTFAFAAIIFCSFWGYVFSYRVEFLQTALERSCTPYKVTVGAVDIKDSSTVIVRNIAILTKEASPSLLVHIPQATLSSPTSSWLFWLCIPSSAPLHLHSLTLSIEEQKPLSFSSPSLNLNLSIDTCQVVDKEGKVTTHHNLHGSIASILTSCGY